ncbi:hypothetical protein HD806DRAFT_3874 [Xylariaceae sp. AK1471]|nr:hypothetical protein HD806DRAFT_3874 [Xylariaceae sp. AK1471]
MDISTLQIPKMGRSRFSKALPTPPPGLDDLDDRPRTAFRDLPALPPAPLPPKEKSMLIKSASAISLGSKGFDSPLPVLPIMAEAPRPRVLAGPITRKPVGQSITPPAAPSANTKPKEMKRMSSISSLLSAYSYSSSDSAQKSSHESDFTKDSEPSYSPEREGMDRLPPVPTKTSMETTNDFYSDKASEVTSYTIIDSFPPPPPLKDPSRPRTPSVTRPFDAVRDGERESASPISLGSGSPRGGREIWRRRASSKSDRGPIIAELKLPGSNGSTASTSHTPAAKAELPLPPPPPAKTNRQPPLPLPPKTSQQSATTLPPRNASLPGRNIRPTKQAESLDEEEEMKRMMKLSKLKELVRRGRGSNDDRDEEQKGSRKTDEQRGHQEVNKQPYTNGNVEDDKPKPPAKDAPAQEPQKHRQPKASVDAQKAEVSLAPVSTSPPEELPAPPPKESSQPTTAIAISRRPVGAQPDQPAQFAQSAQSSQPALPRNRPELGLGLSTQSSNTLQPDKNPVGTLPHPSQRQRQRPSPAYPHNGSSPTSPTGRALRHMPTFDRLGQSPATSMAESNRTPGFVSSPDHGHQPQPRISNPVSPQVLTSTGSAGGVRKNSVDQDARSTPQEFVPPPRTTSITTSQPSFHVQPTTLSDVHEEVTSNALDDEEVAEETREPMSAAAAAAVARFPRQQNWNVKFTADGVQPSKPIDELKYSCYQKHTQFLPSPNVNNPLSCQTCGIADLGPRRSCTYCHLRICLPCLDLLIANGRDLRATTATLKEQGKARD